MKSSLSFLATAAALAGVAMGHYRFYELIVNNTITGQYEYIRQNTNDNSPVTDVTSDDMRCNVGGLTSGPETSVATVLAGSTVGFELDIAIYHPGPLAVYMSKVTPGFTVQTYDGSGPWFKILEMGAIITPTSIDFADDNLPSVNFTIPETVPPGDYLLRVEQLALHVAESVGGAQWYISCAQITVNGPGGGNPGPTALIPGVYSPTDPGILIDIYYPIPTNYTPPGPPVWTGGSAPAGAPTPTTTRAPSTISTVVPTPTTVTTQPSPTVTGSSGSSGATAAEYGQCGGIGWTGATACVAGTTCTVLNSYYSQCLAS